LDRFLAVSTSINITRDDTALQREWQADAGLKEHSIDVR